MKAVWACENKKFSDLNYMKRVDPSGQILFSQLLLEEATYPC